MRCREIVRSRRQFEEEDRATALVPPVADRPADRANDAVAHGQTQTGALTHRLSGEERLEQARLVFRSNAGAVVTDLEPDVVLEIENHDLDVTIRDSGT